MKTLLILLILAYNLNTFGQDIDYAKDIIKTLSSEEFGGRGYSDNGNKLAADYIIEEYTKNGLLSFNKGYSHPFKIEVNTFPGKMKLQINNEVLIPGVDYLVDPTSPTFKGTHSVIAINKKDLLDENKLRALINTMAKKVVIIDERQFENKEKEKQANEIVNYLKYNPQATSVATIIITNQKLSWYNATAQLTRPVFTINKDIDLANIKNAHIEIDAKITKARTENIIGYIEGTEQPDSFLMITAHYDHLGRMGSETYFPGANDNASGIAMLLNLSKHFKENPHKYSIVFTALSAEEIGLIGAKQFVNDSPLDLNRIKFLINFDLAGTGEDGIKVVNGSIYRDEFDILSKINEDKAYLKSVDIRGEACNSDHCIFYEKGVPCFYIYTLGGISAYHDVNDKPETLPLHEFTNYFNLMTDFIETIKE